MIILALVSPPSISTAASQPETTITSAVGGPMADGITLPLENGGGVPLDVVTFEFTSDVPADFECRLDGVAASCTSPVRFARLEPGAHRFAVTAIDRTGIPDPTPATLDWTIGPMTGAIESNTSPQMVIGPHRVGPRRFRRLRGFKPRKEPQTLLSEKDELEAPTLPDEAGDDDCSLVGCPAYAEGEPPGGVPARSDPQGRPAKLPDTPGLSYGPFEVNTGGNDPNIAASSTHLVATNNSVIRFFNKSGTLLAKDKNGNSVPGAISAAEFFKWFFDPSDPNNLNTILNLPAGLECDPTIYPWKANWSTWQGDPSNAAKAATEDCLDTIYDTRVVFDEFRDRFWLVSSARNGGHSYYDGLPDPAQRVGRRDFLLVAISLTQDPRDGWWIWAMWSTLHTGACNNIGSSPGPPPLCPGTPYRPGDAADYPSIGISRDHFVVTINVVFQNPWNDDHESRYTNVSALDANAVANGTCQGCAWTYSPFQITMKSSNGSQTFTQRTTTQPAVHHAANHGWALLTSTYPQWDLLAVIGFDSAEGLFAPPLHVMFLPASSQATSVKDMPQPATGVVTDPKRIKVSNLGTIALKAVARGARLYTVWQDCKKWIAEQSECSTSIRLYGLGAVGALQCPPNVVCAIPIYPDRLFGRRNYKDPQGALVYYGNPAVEVNGDGHAVVVYTRSGDQVSMEARYSAFMNGEPDIRPSETLNVGSATIGTNKTAEETSILNLDTGGIAVDPFDDKGVWMAHAFSFVGDNGAGSWDTAVGKVFGSRFFDLSILGKKAIILKPNHPKAGERATITAHISNDGDARSKQTTGKVMLVRKKRRVTLETFSIRRLRPGRSKTLRINALLPGGLDQGRYELRIDLKRGKEYSKKNNSAKRKVCIGSC